MQNLLTSKIRLPNFNDEWQNFRLEDICFKKSSSVSEKMLMNNNGEYKIYGANGIIGTVDFYTEEEKFIGIVKDGAGVGRVFLCEAKSSVLSTINIIKNKSISDLIFLFYSLCNIDFIFFIKGSTIPHIYFKDYSKIKIKLPNLKEQQKIAEILIACDDEIKILENKLQSLKTQKQGLMQNLLTGKVRV